MEAPQAKAKTITVKVTRDQLRLHNKQERERRAAEKRAALVEVRRCSALGTSWLPCNTLGWCWRSVLQRGKRFTTRSCNAHQVLQQCVLLRFLLLPLPSHRILG